MATSTIARTPRDPGENGDSSALQAAVGDEIRAVADVSPADLQDPTMTWRTEIWHSVDGVDWRFLCGDTYAGRAGRVAGVGLGSPWLNHYGGDLAGHQIRVRVRPLARRLSIGASLDVAVDAVSNPRVP